jgi:branched-chain amino acid transport system substrate-binding protein
LTRPWPLLPALALLAASPAPATETTHLTLPVLVPITGVAALEGTSQRNGALLALKNAPPSLRVVADVEDTGSSPEQAANAFEKVSGTSDAAAVVGPILGTQMLALLPLAEEAELPLLTVSGTARLTQLGNPWIFRFFPSDAVVKTAQARYAVEELGRRRPAIIYQNDAYGQSGRDALRRTLATLGAAPVSEEGLDNAVKDMLPALRKAKEAGADVLLLHLHSGPSALLVRQAASFGIGLPIVAGSGMHQPSTAALLDPAELKGVCAETASSPVSGGSPAMESFLARYRAEFNAEPDAFAVGAYDGVAMALQAVADGALTGAAMRDALAGTTYDGLAMTYRSDGKGNMAHSAVIVCYDGKSRVPAIVKRYENVDGVL